ncbi:hypothetical protein FA95DRAFT_1048219 [Auriscalpium vulgare]|uniref:Uncharacterized protein n=1 Tax=Auriscalpium vulgare TaxID=40419 RepID=A0ACB8SA02_9AGAM|nr:hypothetical protein FA95DRAFT_1048219 [Auriscalpium vulgare]
MSAVSCLVHLTISKISGCWTSAWTLPRSEAGGTHGRKFGTVCLVDTLDVIAPQMPAKEPNTRHRRRGPHVQPESLVLGREVGHGHGEVYRRR